MAEVQENAPESLDKTALKVITKNHVSADQVHIVNLQQTTQDPIRAQTVHQAMIENLPFKRINLVSLLVEKSHFEKLTQTTQIVNGRSKNLTGRIVLKKHHSSEAARDLKIRNHQQD